MSRRLVLLGLSLLCVLFATYGSFVPLQFTSMTLADAVQQFADTPFIALSRASRSDFLTNVLLFVPIGFFTLGAAADRSRRLAVALLLPVLALAAALSVAIEFGQIFIDGRTSSWNDVVAESLGSAVGALLWVAVGSAAVDWLAALTKSQSASERGYRLLGLYAGLWLILSLLPFDFTVRPEELAGKLRAGRIVLQPFSDRSTLRDAGGTLLMAIPLGAFGVVAARHRRVPRPALVGLCLGLVVTWGIAIAQVFSFTRIADITDLLMNSAGVVIGLVLAGRWVDGPLSALVVGPRRRLWLVAALVLWCLMLVIRHWSPFAFVTDPSFIWGRIPVMMAMPFSNYYVGFAPRALVDATTKLLMAVPVGALLQLIWLPQARQWRWLMAVGVVALSAALFLALELGQLMLPSRVPDQTDVYIGTLGAALGVALVWLIARRRS